MYEEHAERYWKKVDVGYDDECWRWTAATDKKWGYGWFRIGRRMVKAHRVSWQMKHGHLKVGEMLCHTCDNPKCVNPSHMYIGDNLTNAHDALRRNRKPLKLTTQDVLDIRTSAGLGVKQCDLARQYGVGDPQISRIVNRKQRTIA